LEKIHIQIDNQESQVFPPPYEENAIISTFVASRRKYLIAKRFFDIAISLLLITLLFIWIIPIISLAIVLNSRGPIFFLQKRVGLNGSIFTCIKFRSMYVNHEAHEKPAEENDPRITSVGKFLRKTKIDELPQLFNVLIGDMSLTGPRPHMIADCHRFSFVVSSYKFRNLMKPGITGLAQIKGYRGPATDYESIQNRYFWDSVYVKKASMTLDVKILYETFIAGIKDCFFRKQ